MAGSTVPIDLVPIADGQPQTIESLRGRRVLAMSAIGDPEGFETTLAELGSEVVGSMRFPDHHAYAASDVDKALVSAVDANADMILTTEKDRVKLDAAWLGDNANRMFALRIEFRFDDPNAMQAILARIPLGEPR